MAARPKHGKTIQYQVWWGGTDFRYREAVDEADAQQIADEFASEGHPTVEILKITTSTTVVDYTPKGT
jgi:hypothetical protein